MNIYFTNIYDLSSYSIDDTSYTKGSDVYIKLDKLVRCVFPNNDFISIELLNSSIYNISDEDLLYIDGSILEGSMSFKFDTIKEFAL